MGLRAKLLPMIHWEIADGETCNVFGEPWFQDFIQFGVGPAGHRNLKVCQLKEAGTDSWDVELLSQLFGYTTTMCILSSVKPPAGQKGADRLIFDPAHNGAYSVKKAYQLLLSHPTAVQGGQQPTNLPIWKQINMAKGYYPAKSKALYLEIGKQGAAAKLNSGNHNG